jgi:hypothetical protein
MTALDDVLARLARLETEVGVTDTAPPPVAGVFAIPTPPVNVAPGEFITSPWGNSVVADLAFCHGWAANGSYYQQGAGSTNVDANTSGTYATWLNLAGPTPPSWATKILVDITVAGIQCVTADCDYYLRTTCNAGGPEALYSGFTNRFTSYRAAGQFSVTPGVVNTVILEARRVGGAGFLRYASGASIAGQVWFRP